MLLGNGKMTTEMPFFSVSKTYNRKLEVNHENASENMSRVAYRQHMAIIYVSFTSERLYFIILTRSRV